MVSTKNNHQILAVSDIIGTMLLLGIAISLFSVVYVSVLSVPYTPASPKVIMSTTIDGNNIIINHYGGNPIPETSKILISIANFSYEKTLYSFGESKGGWDANNDGFFNIGEELIYTSPYMIDNVSVGINIIDDASNSIIMNGVFNKDSISKPLIDTYVHSIYPYIQGDSEIKITVEAGSFLSTLSLYYRYSTDNTSWDSYVKYGNDLGFTLWEWNFNFPRGKGYYEFYSLGTQSGFENEQVPINADAICRSLVNNAPNAPSNPAPSDLEADVNINIALEVVVTDPDSDQMNVTFYNASDDSVIGIHNNVASGNTALTSWAGLSYLTSYSWYVQVTDDVFTTTSPTWSFTTKVQPPNNPPDIPINPLPSDGAIDIQKNPTLEVDVNDLDGDEITVSFYEQGGSLIGADTVIGSGKVSVPWNEADQEGTTYNWYVVANDSYDESLSPIWSFRTIDQPVWTTLSNDSFEDTDGWPFEFNWGNFKDGGTDCRAYMEYFYAYDGWYAILLRDDSSSSYTELQSPLDLDTPGYNKVKIDFYAYYRSIESDEYIRIRFDGNTVWSYYPNGNEETFIHHIVWVNESDYTFDSSVNIRFETEFGNDNDEAFLDQICIKATK